MADPTAVSMILDPLILIFNTVRSVNWTLYLSWVFHVVVSLPLRLVAVPLRFLAGVLFVVFSPALYVIAYIWGWVSAVLAFMASLEPLYTFFGVAATVGIITGLTLALSSSIITASFNMQDSSSLCKSRRRNAYLDDGSISSNGDEDEDEETPSSSSNEKEWQWLDPAPLRRRPAGGLLSQIILEEDDD
ncbi:hypothetical protein NLU13_1747 [Sarocladium strictum]|uniref:Uncharacterized protein n=1 Tax=Sarocladium strictum TaxID=5046 RepID=A0AA39LC29_SARSR|nr:hypothetical protein NLU13_1747 [Sarocladium strictum]